MYVYTQLHLNRSELLQASFLQWDFDPAAVLNTLTDHFDIRHAKIDILSPVYKGKKSQQQQEESDEDDDDEEDDDDDGEGPIVCLLYTYIHTF